MSESGGGGGPGRREVAVRLFAAEYDDSDFSYSESDEERAPNYVITPTGARVNRVFVVGVLTEVENVSEDYLRARIVDPTGPFVVYAGQYQPEAMNFLERADPPMFVAVTGKARTFQPEDSDRVYTSIRPESVSEVDADTRDRWVVQAAERTIERVARAAEAKLTGLEGERLTAALKAHDVEDGLATGIPLALDHYGTTGDYLAAVDDLALDAARVVAGERDEVEGLAVAPDEGTDDLLADLAERTIDVDAIEPEETEGVDLSEAPEPDEEPSPTDEEIDEAVATADVEADDGGSVAESTTEESASATTEAASDESVSEEPTGEQDVIEAGTTDTADATETVSAATEGATAADAGEDSPTEPAPEADTDADDEATTGANDEAAAEADDLEEFDGEFELDEEERAEIEEEYGTEFQSGSEVEEPGEADIETPDEPPAEPGEADALDDEDDEEFDESADEDEEDEEVMQDFEEADAAADDDDEGSESAGEVALDDAVMDAMTDLDDGDGADRDAVVAEVVESTGADPGDVEDAIQEALMDGRCYEPDDETLKAI